MYDGYNSTSTQLSVKMSEMESLFLKQQRIDNDIKAITDEMEKLPNIPKDLDNWTDSLADTNKPTNKIFKISDFSKMFKMGRKYKALIEERENNSRHMKMAILDNLLIQIKNAENK